MVLNPEQSNDYFFGEIEEKVEKELKAIGNDELIEIDKLISSGEDDDELIRIIDGERDVYEDYLKAIGYDGEFNIINENNLIIDIYRPKGIRRRQVGKQH